MIDSLQVFELMTKAEQRAKKERADRRRALRVGFILCCEQHGDLDFQSSPDLSGLAHHFSCAFMCSARPVYVREKGVKWDAKRLAEFARPIEAAVDEHERVDGFDMRDL
jgi:hypothetical protein